MSKLLCAVSPSSWHRFTIERNVAISFCKVVITLLHPQQVFEEVIRHLLAALIESIKVVIVRVTAFVVRQPNWLACSRIKPQHVINRVHALIPVQAIIFQMLVALRRIKHTANDLPTLRSLVISHGTSSLFPLASFILSELAV